VRAVRGAKGIVHVDIAQPGHGARQRIVVLLFPGPEPRVLEERDGAGRQRAGGGGRGIELSRVDERDRTTN
jgi:hypothetical protein